MTHEERVLKFLAGDRFAVVGASRSRSKYGNRIVRCYQQNSLDVVPVNPNADEIEGLKCFPDLSSLPDPVYGASIITPPHVTEQVVEEAAAAGIKHLWMQPGAESDAAIQRAEELDINVIGGWACLLVVLGFHDG